MQIEGGCHCGLVRFTASVPDRTVQVDECDCSICRRSGYLHLLVPAAAFQVLRGAEKLTTYRFGTGTAQHMFCSRCGIKSFYKPRSHPNHISINYRCVDEGHGLDATFVPFDGKNHPGVVEP